MDVREYIEIIVKTSRKDSDIRTIDGTAQKITREIRPLRLVNPGLLNLNTFSATSSKPVIDSKSVRRDG